MVADERPAAFVWITLRALAVIREATASGKKPRRPVVLAVYTALVELANERRLRTEVGGDSSGGFEATNARVADLAGVDGRTVRDAVRVLEGVGLVEVERRARGAASRNPPNRYRLKEPANPPGLSPSGPGKSPGLSPPGPANPPGLSPDSFKKEHPSRKGKESDSGTASGGGWDRFLSGKSSGGDFEPDDLGASMRERVVQGAVS